MNKIKKLFETPKKAFLSILCIAILLLAAGTGAVLLTNTIARKTSIGEENARTLAFSDAGIDPALIDKFQTEFDFEQGIFVYDVEFTSGGISYEYRLKASDGTILKKELDPPYSNSRRPEKPNADAVAGQPLNETPDSVSPDPQPSEPLQQNDGQITLDAAKEAALSDAGVSPSDVTYTKEKLDYEDGIPVYDIEFYTSDFEYEYEINAATGEIYSRDVEAFSTGINQNGNYSGTQVSVDDAKASAAAHAGFSVSDVTFSKTELDMEHGQTVYEIEFFKDGREYEYKINAATGDILEYDIDHNH